MNKLLLILIAVMLLTGFRAPIDPAIKKI